MRVLTDLGLEGLPGAQSADVEGSGLPFAARCSISRSTASTASRSSSCAIAAQTSRRAPIVLVRAAADTEVGNGLARLTDRELALSAAAVGGASDREIAASLYYSVKSVEAYLTRAYRKLGSTAARSLARCRSGNARGIPT